MAVKPTVELVELCMMFEDKRRALASIKLEFGELRRQLAELLGEDGSMQEPTTSRELATNHEAKAFKHIDLAALEAGASLEECTTHTPRFLVKVDRKACIAWLEAYQRQERSRSNTSA